jgi:WD40 repeat protein
MNAITRLDETIRRRAHTVEINRMLAGGFPYSRNLRAHSSCVNALAFRKDGRFLASAGDDLRIHLWDFHQDDLQSPSFTLQGPLVAFWSYSACVRLLSQLGISRD